MAEEIVVTQPAVAQTSGVDPEVDRMMQIHLNNGIEPKPAAETLIDTAASGAAPAATSTDYFTPIKEKFGYQSHEDAIKEIEELRKFKETPQTALPKFENETSEKLFQAISKGDQTVVYQILAQQHKLDSLTSAEVTEGNAADIIKLGMSLKHKDLTEEEINYRFNKQFAIPKEPIQGENELDPEFDIRKAEWHEAVKDIKMNKIIEAKLAKPELETAKSKIVLPEFSDTVDEDYIQYQKQLEEQPKRQEEIEKAYKSFTPKIVETKIPFNDEANKIGFEFQYEPDSESFNQAVEMAMDINKFFAAFKNPDGTPDRQGYLRTLHSAMNLNKIITEAMKQAKNATIKSFLPDNSGGVVRQLPQQQTMSELDQRMQAAGIAPAGR